LANRLQRYAFRPFEPLSRCKKKTGYPVFCIM